MSKLKIILIVLIFIIISFPVYSKRGSPPVEIKLYYNDVIILITNNYNEIGLIKFIDKEKDTPFLTIQIYAILYDWKKGKDVQDVFIKSTITKGDLLIVTNELDLKYLLI